MEENEIFHEFGVCTFNLRNGVFNDGRNCWNNRRDVAQNAFANHPNTRIICTQEGSPSQLDNFLEDLTGEWERIGIGRENSGNAGEEHCCIFYDCSRFEQQDSGDFALSDTPECLGSKSWDTACCRMCTWVILKHKSSGYTFMVVNTHLDHVSEEARIKGCELIMNFVENRKESDAALFCGDFNCSRYSKVWARCNKSFQDAFIASEEKTCNGKLGTFHAFKGANFSEDCEEQHIGIAMKSLDPPHA